MARPLGPQARAATTWGRVRTATPAQPPPPPLGTRRSRSASGSRTTNLQLFTAVAFLCRLQLLLAGLPLRGLQLQFLSWPAKVCRQRRGGGGGGASVRASPPKLKLAEGPPGGAGWAGEGVYVGPPVVLVRDIRGCRNEKKKLGVSNTPYDGGRWVTDGGWWVTDGGWWVTDGGWWVTDGGWWVTDGGWWVTDGGWWVTDGGWWVTDGGWWVTDGGWWVATKHQRVDAIVGKKKGERPYGTPCGTSAHAHRCSPQRQRTRHRGGCSGCWCRNATHSVRIGTSGQTRLAALSCPGRGQPGAWRRVPAGSGLCRPVSHVLRVTRFVRGGHLQRLE